MAFPVTPLDIEVSIALSADLSDPDSWSWTDITDYVREQNRVEIRRGRTGFFTSVTASRCTLTLDNEDGRFCRHNPSGLLFGQIGKNTPLRVRVNNGSGYVTRFVGYVTGWPPTWDPSESDQTVPVSADGIMRRLGRDDALGSSMRRYLERLAGTVPVASWSMEDGQLVTFATPIHGAAKLRPFVGAHPSGAVATYPQWGKGTLAPWLPSVVSRSGNGGLSILWAPVSMPGFTSEWAIDFVYNSSDDAAVSAFDVNPSYLSGSAGWPQLTLDPDAETVSVSFDGSPETTTTIKGLLFDGNAHHVRWHAQQSGADVTWTVYIDAVSRQTGTETTSTLTAISNLGLTSETSTGSPIALGYVTVWTTPGSVGSASSAASGHDGELVDERVLRLCVEEGVPVTVVGESSQPMGPQRPKRLLDLLDECRIVDDAILYEPLDAGLGFLCQSMRITRTPSLALDYSQGHLSPPWDPIDDDRDFVNNATATRPDGYPQYFADDESIARDGSYPLPISPNTQDDEQALDLAAWITAQGTVDELRWPAVRPNLRGSPGLIDDWLATDIGDQITVANHPSPLAPGDISQVIEGYTEILAEFTFDVTLTLSPALIYDSVGRWGLLAHELHASVNSSATSIDIATTDLTQPLLETDSAIIGSGYGVTIGGEELQLTAVAASTITYGAVGTVAHANNASVTPSLPASTVSGNLLVIFAAIRNSGSGVPVAPAGYTRLPVFPSTANCQIFAKIAGGSETNPTVTFSGGAANADTTAQIIRLAGKWHDVDNILIGSASCLNTSAQNIQYPGLSTPCADDAIIIRLGWKADDWTSVANPIGYIEIDEPDTTTGDDQGIYWAYLIQTVALAQSSGSFVVTGGAGAISRGAVMALRCDYQTATVTRSANGVSASHSAGDAVTMTRPLRWGLV